MKHFYAIIITVAVLNLRSTAQFIQNFDAPDAQTSGCNMSMYTGRTTNAAEVISGTASLFASFQSGEAGTKQYSTPYLNVSNSSNTLATTTWLDISFKYKLTENLSGQASRTILVGLQGPADYKPLAVITMNENNNPLMPVTFNHSFIVPAGVYRLVLKMSGSQGNSAIRTIIDDLHTNVNAYYSLGGTCNTAPQATNDIFFTSNNTGTSSFTSVLANDNEPNNEKFTMPVVEATSPDGTVAFNSDGSFIFTPNANFTGISTTFSYRVFDKGYDPMSSTATVTIYFMSASVLPVKLTSFNGMLADQKAKLSWSVANNEDAARMELEKSNDGKNYTIISVVLPTAKQGDEKYGYMESKKLENIAYYRLRLIDKSGAISYSSVVMLSVTKGTTDMFTLIENPVKNTIRFTIDSRSKDNATMNIYDLAGRKIASRVLQLQEGRNQINADLDQFISKGSYVLELTTAEGRQIAKFMKQ